MALLMMITVAYFAHKNKWGGGHPRSSGRASSRRWRNCSSSRCFPVVIWVADHQGGIAARTRQWTVLAGWSCCFAADRIFRFNAVLPIMTPVLLIGGMTAGVFTATEGAIAACVWALFLGIVWYPLAATGRC